MAVADQKGFRRAADACDVAQPSLSMQVALAERQLGVQIFERDSRSVRVSRASAQPSSSRPDGSCSPLASCVTSRDSRPIRSTGRCGSGSSPRSALPAARDHARPSPRRFPICSCCGPRLAQAISCTSSRRAGSTASCSRSRPTSAISTARSSPATRSCSLASPKHALVRSAKPTSADVLNGQVVLLLDDGHCFREQALSFCTQASAGEHSFRATCLATLVQMVSAGTAVTLLPSLALPVENRRGQLRVRRFTAPAPGRTIALAWRRGSALRQPLITLAATIRGGRGPAPARG